MRSLRVRTLFVLTAMVVLGCAAAKAQRLPAGVTPEHYTLHLTPDLKTATFTGEESIDVKLDAATDHVTLNSIEIDIQDVTAEQACAGCTNGDGVKLKGTRSCRRARRS